MKITLLLLFSFLVISTCSAQINAGTLFVGGSASFSRQANKTTQDSDPAFESIYFNYNLNPKTGFFISDNVALGLGINYYNSRNKNKGPNPTGGSNNYSLGFNPFGRYYKMLGERAGFFGQFTVSYTNGKDKSDDFINRRYSSLGAGIAPGFVFFATPKIGIETTIGNIGYTHYLTKYYSRDIDSQTESSTNQFAANIEASNIFLGINFYLGR